MDSRLVGRWSFIQNPQHALKAVMIDNICSIAVAMALAALILAKLVLAFALTAIALALAAIA